mmetsp:Transcript_17932/g.41044  ORF Transcript_17932/g.41044 Transcript_17932/m.41044 type:complete len:132 (-) Transcript_17932:684-1079(-)
MASLEHAGIEADEASSASTGGAPEQPSTEEITEPPKKRKMPHTVEEKIKAAQDFKEKGNEFFKAKDFKKAITQYARVFAYTTGLSAQSGMEQYHSAAGRRDPTHEEKASIQQLQVPQLRAKDWSAVACCPA